MRWLKRKILLFLIFICIVIALVWISYQNTPQYRFINSWVFTENKRGPVIGDLGGITVSIPQPIPRFVEYQDDPHFMEKRKGDTPIRTFQSKLRSFGFEIRYPDMAVLNENTFEEKRKSTIHNTMWMDVGVSVEPYYDQFSLQGIADGFTKRIWDSRHTIDEPPEIWKDKHGYKRLADTLYGLVVYSVYGYDDAKRYIRPGIDTHDILDANIYYHLDDKDIIDSYITCSNVKHDAAPCEHQFILPSAKNTLIKVHYRIGFLPQWQKIQYAIEKVILGFSVNNHKISVMDRKGE